MHPLDLSTLRERSLTDSDCFNTAETACSARLPPHSTLSVQLHPFPAPTSPTLASTTPQPVPGGGPFKLKLKVGGASAAPPAAAPALAYAPPPPAAPQYGAASAYGQGGYGQPGGTVATYGASGVRGDDDEGGERASASKYRKLKRKYLEAVESRDDASLALHRAQKLIHRLREDKAALLDRVVQLEVAAGLTSHDVSVTRDETLRNERELAFPLLHPPSEPSLADRPLKPPVIRTDTDLSNPNYNKPIGPEPLPHTFPPRHRSHHLRTAIAAQKLRDEHDAQRAAHGLGKPSFPAVAVLGLRGSTVAANVERALAGEAFEGASDAPAARANKRRRESFTGVARGGGGRARTSASAAAPEALAPPPPAPVMHLPNPFAAIGAAIPVGSTMARNNAEALAASSAPAPIPVELAPTPVVEPSPAATPAPGGYDDDAMDGEEEDGGGYVDNDDAEDYKPSAKERRAAGGSRKSEGLTGQARPKKVRVHGVTSATHQIPPIARGEDGTPYLPVTVGVMIIRNLGAVDQRENYHTERYIFPVGYEATRRYLSMVDSVETAEYVCRVVDGGSNGPRFEIHPSDQPGVILAGGTPTAPWSQVVRTANKIRDKQHSGSVSGPDYFGFSANLVKAMIQELPGANQVKGYIWQQFVENPALAAANTGGNARRESTFGKRSSRRRSGRDQTSMSPGPEDGIEVGDVSTGGYEGDYAVDGGGVGDYNSPVTGGYVDEYSPVGSPVAYGGADFGPNSIRHLLAAAQPADPYAIPPAMPGDLAVGGLDPFLAVTAAAAAATPAFDPYAIPPVQNGMLDPAFANFANDPYAIGPQ
ncbi:hypothetical protein JCM8097_001080 [Rhodosporidiobolus ruineniae]